jgi:hypothetical protein
MEKRPWGSRRTAAIALVPIAVSSRNKVSFSILGGDSRNRLANSARPSEMSRPRGSRPVPPEPVSQETEDARDTSR